MQAFIISFLSVFCLVWSFLTHISFVLYITVYTMQSSVIVRLDGSQKKILPFCVFFYFCSSDPQNKRYVICVYLILILNVVCTVEVGAAVWGTPSNLCHNC